MDAGKLKGVLGEGGIDREKDCNLMQIQSAHGTTKSGHLGGWGDGAVWGVLGLTAALGKQQKGAHLKAQY